MTPGQFELEAPVGTVYAEVIRGFEYTPLREVLAIAPGQTELRLSLRRWSDAREHGYYSGDVHVHFFGTATLSFSDGVKAQPGDIFEIEADAFCVPLRNPLAHVSAAQVRVRSL